MKTKCSLTGRAAFCMAVCILSRHGFGESFHSDRYGYTLTVPDTWKRVSQSTVDGLLLKVQKPGNAHPITYDMAFQPASHPAGKFVFPYVIVQILPYSDFGRTSQINEDEFPDVVKAITGVDISKAVNDNLSAQAKSLVNGMSFGQPDLDKVNRLYRVSMSLNAAAGGSVHGALTGHFGREAIAQVMYYSTEGAAADTAAAKTIGDSLRFDAGKNYSEAEAQAHPTHRQWVSGVGNSVIVGLVVGAAVGLIAVIAKLKRN